MLPPHAPVGVGGVSCILIIVSVCMRYCACVCSATGQGLSFMTVDDIKTLAGYPHHKTSHHVQTRLMFYYKTDCELCRVVNANVRRRRRRQTEFDGTQRVLTNDLVHEVLDDQA